MGFHCRPVVLAVCALCGIRLIGRVGRWHRSAEAALFP